MEAILRKLMISIGILNRNLCALLSLRIIFSMSGKWYAIFDYFFYIILIFFTNFSIFQYSKFYFIKLINNFNLFV